MRLIRTEEDIQQGLRYLVAIDPRLIPIAAAAGPLPLRLSRPGFAGLSFIIVSQMVSKASATAIWNRMSAAGAVTPKGWLSHRPETISSFGLSAAKKATLANLAVAVLRSDLDLEEICRAEPETAIAQLTALPGIGPWTAEVYLMLCGGHPDVFPAGDVALQASLARAFRLPERPGARVAANIASTWAPWRSVAARLFWSYYSTDAGKDAVPLAP
ncbi:DNA-3-methyladenine glycosylase family protein [Rhizobium halophilum]|uniref:DNA-3-methyladenine glycosylase family protein n=1 Tax=Rhizobium halophilum TaxID=2846852 RepID=UPI001EFD28A3|nr:DNA-3-methyladenine glycosylase 2 family protein [Rhizobium halophilum]MCF6368757.1 DNA-3-methyladenine glycosylase 2 family protein [Rhizobium halophilum]